MRRPLVIVAMTAAVAAAGCASPEATRTRGGGPGADPGNRPAQVLMHEGSRQYWKTPVRIPMEPMPLDAAQQARQLSLRSSNGQRSAGADQGR
jgi:hypothetical protein